MRQVVLASGNAGKLIEFGQCLAPLGIELVAQSQFVSQEVEETGLSFVENAILKARHAAAASGLPALADDSGLEVDALHGAPGIYSARYAGSALSGAVKDAANSAHLIANLKHVPSHQRNARFQCVLVYMRHAQDPTPLICQAAWEGVIMDTPQGEHGFGYDPIFQVLEKGCRAAQLTPQEKISISHRGQALAQLQRALV
ncbi:MAG: RdgB/HAM1 family non-canonical purine NTP pyrophosphatase [Oceanospirillaceae bacterium]|jgi:XTP/dITP diphosphohydrolase|nr:RdgB/HAM1 family non-canonical purine NTP pyrophosphatase [Oceanospirillaceae bacterium]